MDELISKQVAIDAFAKKMPRLTTPDGCGQFDREIQIADEAFVDCMTIINELPSADAVSVIRCRDCRFATWYDAADGVKRCFCDIHGSAGHTETDFCSYAEREETD